jgi:glycosyltransferase involved in cell wall biosynthesis
VNLFNASQLADVPRIGDYRRRALPTCAGGRRLRNATYEKRRDPGLPLISIVTTVRNGERTLQGTLDSVLSQHYPNVEYIIVDGGSTDHTLQLIRNNEQHLDLWFSERDRGIYDGMNRGIAYATGDLIKLLNADDLLTPHSLSNAAACHQAFAASGQHIIRSDVLLIDERGRVVKEHRSANADIAQYFHMTWYVPKPVYEEHGLYRLEYPLASDYDFFCRVKQRGVRMVVCDEPLLHFRLGGRSHSFRPIYDFYAIDRHYHGQLRALSHLVLLSARWYGYQLIKGICGDRAAYAVSRAYHRLRQRLALSGDVGATSAPDQDIDLHWKAPCRAEEPHGYGK